MVRLQAIKPTEMTPKLARNLRHRWQLDIPTLAGRADLSVANLKDFEAGRIHSPPLIFRINLAKALRQMAFERAQEAVALFGPAIEADPDAELYQKKAAKIRFVRKYGRDE